MLDTKSADDDAVYSIPTKRQQQRLKNVKVGDRLTLSDVNHEYELCWKKADQTPAGMPVCDCRSHALGDLIVGMRKPLVDAFLKSREGLGEDVLNQFLALSPQVPSVQKKARFSVKNPHGTQLPTGPIFRSPDSGVRWEIYHFFGHLILVRSFERRIEYVLKYELRGHEIYINSIAPFNLPDDAKDESPLYHQRVVEHIMFSHLHHVIGPHPVPASVGRNPEDMAQYSYHRYGELGYYAYVSDDVPEDFDVTMAFLANVHRTILRQKPSIKLDADRRPDKLERTQKPPSSANDAPSTAESTHPDPQPESEELSKEAFGQSPPGRLRWFFAGVIFTLVIMAIGKKLF